MLDFCRHVCRSLHLMMAGQEHINDLIVRYLTGDIDERSAAELREWITASKANQDSFAEYQEIWFSSGMAQGLRKYEMDKDQAYARFLQAIRSKEGTSALESTVQDKKGIFLKRWLQVAAAIVVIMVVSYIAYNQGQYNLSSEFANVTIKAPMGSRSSTVLPDGTQVWLNAGSELSYSQGFGINDRKVVLNGEGFFSVKHNAKKPFTVHSSSMKVTVLGTKFNVRDYADDNTAEVALEEGKVALDNLLRHSATKEMKPGDKIILDKTTGDMIQDTHTSKSDYSWKAGTLVFEGDGIDVIAKKIERSYNIKVYVRNPELQQLKLHATFLPGEQSLREVLNSLKETKKVRYKLYKDKVILY